LFCFCRSASSSTEDKELRLLDENLNCVGGEGMWQLHIRQQEQVLAEGGGCNCKAHNPNLVGEKRRGYEGCNSKVQNLHCVEEYVRMCNSTLKVLTNEKTGGLAVVAFDRFRFKLFSRKFSNKFVLAPSCERPKTAPRTLFLLFESNNCFPITV
jgi:hypothetical protein